MCYPKPGPRCAGHLKEQIAQLEVRRTQVADAFIAGREPSEDPNRLNRDLTQAREEYDETATARTALSARIEQMVDGPGKDAAITSLAFAAARYQAKVTAYQSTLTEATGEVSVEQPEELSADPDAPDEAYNPTAVVGELGDHELAHLGIFTATLADGRVVAHNVNGPNVICPVCKADRTKQATCTECAGRGKVDNIPYCPRNWDSVADGLFLGGHDNQPDGGDARVTNQFDMVVSLYQRDGFGPDDGVAHHTHAMIDGDLDPDDYPHVHRLADHVAEAMDKGQTVLVRCQAGMNRSALISGLALIKRGWTTDEAISRMREVRSDYVLFNESFVAYLRTQEAELGGTRARCSECKGHRQFFGVTCATCDGDGYVTSTAA